MPVVKARQTHHLQTSAIVMDLADLEIQARTLIAHAQSQAAAILQSARDQATAEATAIREEARRAGHEAGVQTGLPEGLEKGRQEALAQHAPAVAQLLACWQQTLGVFQENLPAHLADARTDLVRLALAIAAIVTRQEALRNPGVVQANVEAALALVTAGRHVVLQLHPEDLTTVQTYMPTLVASFKNVAGIELQTDPTVARGGCITRFGAGQVDARLDTQIQRIADELLAKEV